MDNNITDNDPPVKSSYFFAAIEKMGSLVGVSIRKEVAKELQPLQTRIAALESKLGATIMLLAGKGISVDKISEVETLLARVKELENNSMQYVGVFTTGEVYHKGQVCTHSGSLWFCWNDTTGTPSKSTDWQLILKNGSANGR